LINHNQVFFSHLYVIGQFIASDFWLMVYCKKPLTENHTYFNWSSNPLFTFNKQMW